VNRLKTCPHHSQRSRWTFCQPAQTQVKTQLQEKKL
jgi:hypothetical protein